MFRAFSKSVYYLHGAILCLAMIPNLPNFKGLIESYGIDMEEFEAIASGSNAGALMVVLRLENCFLFLMGVLLLIVACVSCFGRTTCNAIFGYIGLLVFHCLRTISDIHQLMARNQRLSGTVHRSIAQCGCPSKWRIWAVARPCVNWYLSWSCKRSRRFKGLSKEGLKEKHQNISTKRRLRPLNCVCSRTYNLRKVHTMPSLAISLLYFHCLPTAFCTSGLYLLYVQLT